MMVPSAGDELAFGDNDDDEEVEAEDDGDDGDMLDDLADVDKEGAETDGNGSDGK